MGWEGHVMLGGHMRIAGISVVIAVVVMMTGLPTVETTAQGGASRTLTIYAAECPAGYTGNASADECDDNPIIGVPFRVGRPFTEAFYEDVPTNSQGLVSFEIGGLPLNGILRIIEQLPAGTERYVAYCVNEAGDPLGISYPDDVGNAALGVADVAVGEIGDIACDWYNVPAEVSQTTEVKTPPATRASQGSNIVQLTEDPAWWIVPFVPGWGNTDEGHLYFGTRVKNSTRETVLVGVSFRAYRADGTPFPGCGAPFGDGPGVTTTIAPGETALLTCTRTIAPRTLDGLQVTVRLWDSQPLRSSASAFEVIEADVAPIPDQSSPMETSYGASALVRATTDRDTDVTLLFRFYDEDDVQVGTCESNPVTIEPEVDQRVECSSPFLLDTVSPQPVRVSVEAPPM